jgi:hypothetical protein
MAVDALAADPAIKTVGLDYGADKAARLVGLIRECVEAIMPDTPDARRARKQAYFRAYYRKHREAKLDLPAR